MPMSAGFETRLYPKLNRIVATFGTPFHIYDEIGIRQTGRELTEVFSAAAPFKEYYAVKALPNPRILDLMRAMGFGFDCSSIAELQLSRRIGAAGDEIMFTSNNTSSEDFAAALADGGCILNLDDVSLLDKLPKMPAKICFRYNPGDRRTGNSIIGNPVEAKYGITHAQMIPAYSKARSMGAERFGLHTMLASNERDYRYMVETARMLLDAAAHISAAVGIRFEFINIGGGLGIPYRPEDAALDLSAMGREIGEAFRTFQSQQGYIPRLYMESGRYMTGPHGALVTTAINRKDTYRTYIGVDACMSSLMRPGMYGAYHHITVAGKEASRQVQTVDVVGALCENNDKFAVQRRLPLIEDGDILCIHDTGAHGHAMGFNYNGQLRPKELLLRADGAVEMIRRAETLEDYFATLDFTPKIMEP